MAEGKPTLFVLAGPEGSGKTTFYEQSMEAQRKLAPELRSSYISADKALVSADKVQKEQLGEQSTRAYGAGNLIANQLARDAIGAGRSVIVETSFAEKRDLDLVNDAKKAGYRVVVSHVQTQSPDLAVARVAERVKEGGRDAPEAAIRAEHARSAPLIAQAAKVADHTFVYDTSALNQAPKHLLTLERGRVTSAAPAAEIPTWAKEAYGQQLQQHREANVSAAEKSFAQAIDKAEQRVPGARVQIAGHKAGEYAGPIVEKTQHHVLQQTGEKDFVAHFKDRLAVVPTTDQNVKLTYTADRDRGKVEFQAPPAPKNEAALKQEVRDFLTQPREVAEKNPRLAAAYAAKDALSDKAWEARPRTDRVEKEVDQLITSSVAARLATGKNVEISRGQVDAVQYQVAARSLDSAIQDKQLNPDRNPRVDPEHRRIIVERSDQVARQLEGKVAAIQPESPAYKEAQRIAAQLAKHDGARSESPFASRELSSAYKQEQTREAQQGQQQAQQRQQGRGMDR
jgi:predicted ABC-type ATPase